MSGRQIASGFILGGALAIQAGAGVAQTTSTNEMVVGIKDLSPEVVGYVAKNGEPRRVVGPGGHRLAEIGVGELRVGSRPAVLFSAFHCGKRRQSGHSSKPAPNHAGCSLHIAGLSLRGGGRRHRHDDRRRAAMAKSEIG
jgi:hypothetical protein